MKSKDIQFKTDKAKVIKLIKFCIIFILNLSFFSFSIKARVIDDVYHRSYDYLAGKVDALCEKPSGVDTTSLCFNQQGILTPEVSSQIIGLKDNVLGDIVDLSYVNSFSKKILLQAADEKDKIELLLTKLKENKKGDNQLERMKLDLEMLRATEYKLKIIEQETNFCNGGRRAKIKNGTLEECKNKKERLFAEKGGNDLLAYKTDLLLRNRIFNHPDVKGKIDDFSNEMFEKYSKKMKGISFCNSKKNLYLCPEKLIHADYKTLKNAKKKMREDVFNNVDLDLPKDTWPSMLEKPLRDGKKGLADLHKRHVKAMEVSQKSIEKFNGKIKKGKSRKSRQNYNNILSTKDARKTIFRDRNLSSDYSSVITQNNANGDKVLKSFFCKMNAQDERNKDIASAKSISADIALMLIPIGGAGILGRIASKASVFNKAKYAKFNLVGNITFEGGATIADLSLLNKEAEHCKAIQIQSVQSFRNSASMKSKLKECKETLDNLSLMTGMALFGGASALGGLAKKTSDFLFNQKRWKKNLPKVTNRDYTDPIIKRKIKEMKQVYKDLGLAPPTVDETKGMIMSHKVAHDKKILGLKGENGLKKGRSEYSKEDIEQKAYIMAASGIPTSARKALMEKGITGVRVPQTSQQNLIMKLGGTIDDGKTFTYYDDSLGQTVRAAYKKNPKGGVDIFTVDSKGRIEVKANLSEREAASVQMQFGATDFVNDIRHAKENHGIVLKDKGSEFLSNEQNFYASQLQDKFGSSFTTKIKGNNVTLDMIFDQKGNYGFIRNDTGDMFSLSAEQMKNVKNIDGKTLKQKMTDDNVLEERGRLALRDVKDKLEQNKQRKIAAYNNQKAQAEKGELLRIKKQKDLDEANRQRAVQEQLAQQSEAKRQTIHAKGMAKASKEHKESLIVKFPENEKGPLLNATQFLDSSGEHGIAKMTLGQRQYIDRLLVKYDNPSNYNQMSPADQNLIDNFKAKAREAQETFTNAPYKADAKISALNHQNSVSEIKVTKFTDKGSQVVRQQMVRARNKQSSLALQNSIPEDFITQIKYDPSFSPEKARAAFITEFPPRSKSLENVHKLLHFEPTSQAARTYIRDAYEFVKQTKNTSHIKASNTETQRVRDFYIKRVESYLDAVDPTKVNYPR